VHHPDDIRQREREFADALKGGGLRMTHQRLEVIRELARAEHHPDAEEIYRAVRERVPTISLDTVYRTLAALVARGLIERIAAPGGARYDPDVSGHHHFVCTRCGCVQDLDAGDVSTVRIPPDIARIGTVSVVRVEMKGLCNTCAVGGVH